MCNCLRRSLSEDFVVRLGAFAIHSVSRRTLTEPGRSSWYLRGAVGALPLLLSLLLNTVGQAQQTHNLEIVWVKGVSDGAFYLYGGAPCAGDLNGDGFSDVVVDADSYVAHDSVVSRSYVFLGGPEPDSVPDLVWNSIPTTSSVIADINGDGYGDLILGFFHGFVNIYLGGNPMDTLCDYVLPEPQPYSSFGCAVAAGDVNGDGYDDLIVGAYGATPPGGSYDMGQVYVYFGGPDFDVYPDVTLNGGHNGMFEGFGFNLAAGGDINRDGFEDIVVGAVNYAGCGRVYVYVGGSPMDTTYFVAMSGERGTIDFGGSGVAFLTDDNDFDRVAAGCLSGRGRIYILNGGPEMDSVPDMVINGGWAVARLGYSTSCAGRIDGGTADGLLAGAPQDPPCMGSSFVWLKPKPPDSLPDAWLRATDSMSFVGFRQICAGDVDGDGRDEIVVTSYNAYERKRVWICRYTGTGIAVQPDVSPDDHLLRASPNPCRSRVMLTYCREGNGPTSIRVRDVSGRTVKTLPLTNAGTTGGRQSTSLELTDDRGLRLVGGVYFVELAANQNRAAACPRQRILVAE
jgi:hypothetical protein